MAIGIKKIFLSLVRNVLPLNQFAKKAMQQCILKSKTEEKSYPNICNLPGERESTMFKYSYSYSTNQNVTPATLPTLTEKIIQTFQQPPFFKSNNHPEVNSFSFIFLSPLNTLDKSTLDSLISSFSASDYMVKVARYSSLSDPFTPPFSQDFATALNRRLYKVNTKQNQGDILQSIYYAVCDTNGNVSDPVIQWDTTVTYHNSSVEVFDNISWIMENNLPHPEQKTLHQVYAGQRWLDWLSSKRAQIISYLRAYTAASMEVAGMSQADTMAAGEAFVGFYATPINGYIVGYDLTFNNLVQSDTTRPWLDFMWYDQTMTIRQKYAQQLVYG